MRVFACRDLNDTPHCAVTTGSQTRDNQPVAARTR
jgi:hypothetical protein